MGPGRGAQRRRFGEPGLSSAASNSMGRFSVAPHAMPLRGQGPGADAAALAAQATAPQWGSPAKPAPMAPPAPGSGAGPASCDVTGARQRPAEGGKPEEGRSGRSVTDCAARGAPAEEVERPGWRAPSPGNTGKAPTPASAPPGVPSPCSRAVAPGWPRGFRTCAAQAWGRGELEGPGEAVRVLGTCSPVTSWAPLVRVMKEQRFKKVFKGIPPRLVESAFKHNRLSENGF